MFMPSPGMFDRKKTRSHRRIACRRLWVPSPGFAIWAYSYYGEIPDIAMPATRSNAQHPRHGSRQHADQAGLREGCTGAGLKGKRAARFGRTDRAEQ